MTSSRSLAILLFAASTLGICSAQQAAPAHNPADTVAAPAPIADTALRQTMPAPQSRGGFISAGWLAHHERNIVEANSGPYDLVFVGDSITDNFHKTGPAPEQVFKPIWDKLFASHHALNLGVSGDSTQHVLWRLANGESDGLTPSNVVLLIGTNNTWHDSKASAQDVVGGIEAVVSSLHTRMPKAKILVLGILPTDVTPAKTEKDQSVNGAIAKFYVGSTFVRTLDLQSLFLKNGVLDLSIFYDPKTTPPGHAVHPNTSGQLLWAEAVADALYGSAR